MSIDNKCIDSIKMLAVDAVEKAKSGHPGIALGAADAAYALWAEHLRVNPKNPSFFNRDRFILSAGHGSALLYSLLCHFGFDVTVGDMGKFRQLHSRTPGHPELGVTAGVETSTGPLGQGYANAVGFAAAEKALAARFNREGMDIIDHYTYVLAGDGCMMEGISYEAGSLAGDWKLNKLIVIYDSNGISIEGSTQGTFCENVAKRHEAMGWNVEIVQEGNSFAAVSAAIERAKHSKDKPTLIEVRTVIGNSSPLANSEKSHGAPLGADNAAKTRTALGWEYAPFTVPDEVKSHLAAVIERGAQVEKEWNELVNAYAKKHPDLYAQFKQINKKIDIDKLQKELDVEYKTDATRNISGAILNKIAQLMPNLVGGTADLSPSTKAYIAGGGNFSHQNPLGRNILFGVREQSMGAIANGIYLHGGFNVFSSTFFVFSDYMKSSVRMSALMELPVLYVFTHDSIGVGEDGPTHQPIEQLVSMRTIPNLLTIRPADGKETAAAYLSWLKHDAPTALVLSRQNLPALENSSVDGALKGGYVLADAPDYRAIIIASGSEVELALKAQQALALKGVAVRVVSMPCMELFEMQSPQYRDSVLPPSIRARVSVEAASTLCMSRYVGLDGVTIGMDCFGVSGAANQLFSFFDITAERVAEEVLSLLPRK